MKAARTMTVVVIGTLDTKGKEIAYLAGRIRASGLRTLIVDSGILGEPAEVEPDVRREEVAASAAVTLEVVRSAGTRGAAIELMARGLAGVVARLHAEGQCDGVVSLGGAEGAVMVARAVQALPVGVPKLIVTPVAAGHRVFAPFVGLRDVTIMHSVVDILGLNPVSRAIFDNAAGAIAGMVRSGARLPGRGEGERLVAVTMLGNTTAGVMRLERHLVGARYVPLVFHANGVGGPCMEEMVDAGLVEGVVDFTTNELMDELVGGLHAAGPHRLEAAARRGVPQVVVPGAVDFFVAGPFESVPERWRARPLYRHNPALTLVRATGEEMAEVARVMADKLGACRGPVAVAVPLGGLSIPNRPGDVFHDPAADGAFRRTLRQRLRPGIPVVEVDAHVNDPVFVDAVFDLFGQVMEQGRGARASGPG